MDLSDSIGSAAAGPTYGVSFTALERQLGRAHVRIERPGTGPAPTISAIDIYDPSSDDIGGEGVLLCLVSAEAMREDELRSAVARAADSRCAGIALKAAQGGAELAAVVDAGLAAVVLAPAVSWREFDAVVTRALGENARSLLQMPSSGDKLFALANTIARAFRGSVAIEDHQRTILAHSSVPGQAIDELRTTGILFRRAGDAPVNELRYRSVLAAEGIVRFERYRDFLPRAAIAVRAGAIPLGTIWALDPEGEAPDASLLAPEKEAALREGAVAAADVLLESWSARNREVSHREAALKRLLIGAAEPGDRELLGDADDDQCVLLVAQVPTGQRAPVRLSEVRAALARHLAAYLPDLVLSVDGNEIVTLCPSDDPELVRAWALTALADLPEGTRAGLRVGLSDPHSPSTQLPFALGEARAVAASAQADNGVVGTVARVRPQLFVQMCREQLELDDRLMLPEAQQLLQDDPVGAETLEHWFACGGSVARTARALHVHEQTVRYRLRKLRQHLDLDRAQPDYLLALWAQVRAFRGRGDSGPTKHGPRGAKSTDM